MLKQIAHFTREHGARWQTHRQSRAAWQRKRYSGGTTESRNAKKS
jgi:hypothetical protein